MPMCSVFFSFKKGNIQILIPVCISINLVQTHCNLFHDDVIGSENKSPSVNSSDASCKW